MTEQNQPSSSEENLCLWCPPITTALLCAIQQRAFICLSYPDRPRELGPVECRLLEMDRDRATLLCRAAALPQPFAQQECSLYFKVREPEPGQPVEGAEMRMPLSAGDLMLTTQERLTGRRYGFYSKTTLMAAGPAPEGAAAIWPDAGGSCLPCRSRRRFVVCSASCGGILATAPRPRSSMRPVSGSRPSCRSRGRSCWTPSPAIRRK